MPKIDLETVMLHCETCGTAGKTPAVPMHGLGSQLTGWPETCLYAFDQRDGGLSSKFGSRAAPEYAADWDGARDYVRIQAVHYTLFDMADDIIDAMASPRKKSRRQSPKALNAITVRPSAFGLRQFWAIMASGDRSELLSTIACPRLAILGRHDISIPLEI